MTEPLYIGIRHAIDTDLPLVRKSFFDSFAHSSLASTLTPSTYMREWWPIIDRLVARSTILIAHAPDSPDIVRGWLMFEPTTTDTLVHFCYVKFDWRNMGIAKALFEEAGIHDQKYTMTHRTIDSVKITSKWAKVQEPLPKYNFIKIWDLTQTTK